MGNDIKIDGSFHEQMPYDKYSGPCALYVAMIGCFVFFALMGLVFVKVYIEEGFNSLFFGATLLPLAGIFLIFYYINMRKNMKYTVDVADGVLTLKMGKLPFTLALKEVLHVDARWARGVPADKVKRIAFHRGIREHYVYVIDIENFLEAVRKWVEPSKILI